MNNWAQFLKENEHLVFHTLEYKKFIEEAFNCNYKMIKYSKENKKIILPIVEVKSLLFGKKIISTAYLEYGGFVGEKKYLQKLIDNLTNKYGSEYDYLEIRGGFNEEELTNLKNLKKANLYHRFVLKIFDKESTWKNIQKSKRKAIKKSLKSVEVKEIPLSELNSFYDLYCKNMRRFGSPPYSKKYFFSFYKNIVDNRLGKVFGTYHQGKLIAALLGFTYQNRVHLLISVFDPKYQQYRPNDVIHWSFIEWACDNNIQYFDFGRVRKESGQFEYKRKWGPELLDLPSYFLLWKSKKIPHVDPSNHQLLVNCWKKLPIILTKIIGPKLRKGLGI